MTEPEQWAVELWRKACHDYGGASIEDTPAEWRAVMAIQRAFEERERAVRLDCMTQAELSHRQALATRQDAPKACEDTSHDQ